MADRYWVGGSGSWNTTSTTNWAATSGGASGASAPGNSDNVFFDVNSSSGNYTVTVTSIVQFVNINIDNPITGVVNFTGNFQFNIRGSMTISSSASLSGCMATYIGSMQFTPLASTTININTNGAVFSGSSTLGSLVNSSTYNLMSALTMQGTLTITSGTLNTNNYSVTVSSLQSSNSNTRAINLGASTVTLSNLSFEVATNLSFNAGTSQINFSNLQFSFSGGGRTFYNVAFTSSLRTSGTVAGQNTFNNFSVTGKTNTTQLASIIFEDDQKIDGTLTLAAGTNATMRTFLCSDVIGTTRTLTINAFSANSADVDFRDIAITGSASPISGDRFGDCKGNIGIAFPASKTVYWRGASTSSWGVGEQWSLTVGGTASYSAFPLAQDIAIFSAEYPANNGSVYINSNYNIGTIDMSSRGVGKNMVLAKNGTSSYTIYGDLTLGSYGAISYITPGTVTLAGRNLQKITSAGTIIQLGTGFSIVSPGGTVRLEDALTMSTTVAGGVVLSMGTFDANNYNVTCESFISPGSNVRSINIGTGTWVLTDTGTVWNAPPLSNISISGSGTISLISSNAKSFLAGSLDYERITLNQGGTGTLTVNGSNTFARLTNTVIGAIAFSAGSTNKFTTIGINGTAGNLLSITSTSSSENASLQKPGAWNMGANSIGTGNINLQFIGTNPNYINASHITGVSTEDLTSKLFLGATNINSIKFGSTTSPQLFYGSTKII